MRRYNLEMIFDPSEEYVLMCYRSKEPYLGLYNLLGGKIDPGESDLDSAYRELFEESGITKDDIVLHKLMTFNWEPLEMEMVVYVGVLHQPVELKEEIHTLHWIPVTENFFDMSKYAGEGNIGHMMEIYSQVKGKFK